MDKLIEIDGRLILVTSKEIEINGERVITQGKIRIIQSDAYVDDLVEVSATHDQARELTEV